MSEYRTPPGESLEPIVKAQMEFSRRISELERPTGTNIASLVDQVQAALVNLNATVIMANLSASGNVTASGHVNGIGGLRSVGAFNTDITVYPGARQPMWQNNNGIIGYAPSTQVKKTNIRDVPFTAEDVRACTPSMFSYIAQMQIRDDPNNEFYDPEYEVPAEAGLFAEELIAHGRYP